jgi:hypothetical protein
MEIAIPLIALGGMYIISNQNSNVQNNTGFRQSSHMRPLEDIQNANNPIIRQERKIDEGFTNMGADPNYLPNTKMPQQNFPTLDLNNLSSTVQTYENPNAATDKYFNQDAYEKRVRINGPVQQDPQQIYSLTGDYLSSDQFKHNNMVPFFGAKIKGRMYNDNIAESILDNTTGAGSQIIKKVEQAPLFKPEESMSWTYGMPTQTDFIQSRINPGTISNNVKPFESEYVGPGLNKGYTTEGSNGFNSGMEARDRWLPKTIDELRVATNPKLEYELKNHEGPSYAYIQNRGIIGRVEKHHPDTFYMNTPDRWFTTTGAEKGEMQRPEQEMGIIRRVEGDTNYRGPAGKIDRQAPYVPSNYEASKRVESGVCDVAPSTAKGRGPITDLENNYNSHTNYANNRSTVKAADTMRSSFSHAIGAVIAPFMDILRPSRKEEVVQNVRVYGEASTSVSQGYVVNPYDTTPTTIKETTMYTPQFYVNNQKEGMYVQNWTAPGGTQRDTTSYSEYGAAGGPGSSYGDRNYSAAYAQTNNDIKAQTIYNHANQGGQNLFNNNINITLSKSDQNSHENWTTAPSSVIKMPASKEQFGIYNATQFDHDSSSIAVERIQPEILSAFRSNPYTHSLTSAV